MRCGTDCDRCRYSDPAECQPRWIPCSERLPDEWKDVIITIDDPENNMFSIFVGYWHDVQLFGDSMKTWIFKYDGEMYTLGDFEKVTAWMPLPEPYGGESDALD